MSQRKDGYRVGGQDGEFVGAVWIIEVDDDVLERLVIEDEVGREIRVIGRKTFDRHRSEIAAFRLNMMPRFCMVGVS